MTIKYYTPSNHAYSNFFNGKMSFTKDMSDADVVVIFGGEDISPYLYSKEQGATRGVNYQKDFVESSAIMEARIYNIPVFGICRGAQLLHVLNGGTLIKHLENHGFSEHNAVNKNQNISIKVNSLHHQAIPPEEAKKFYGEDCCLFSEDEQATEAFIDTQRRVGGVQFHPEFGSCPKVAVDYSFDLIKKLLEV